MSRFFGRTGVGFVVSIPITCIVAGGVENAFGFLLLSIICTAGIGLVVWIPLWWILGWATLAVLASISKNVGAKSINDSLQVPSRESPQMVSVALMTYIRKASDAGTNNEELTRRLQSNGWEIAEIQRAIESLDSTGLNPRQSRPREI